MKKNRKKIIIISIIATVLLLVAGIIVFNILTDENKLTVNEKKWISDNQGVVQSINVINNLNTFGSNGEGVFFDFLNDFGKNYNLDINPITYNKEDSINGISFKISTSLEKNNLLFHEDHFVLVSKNEESYRSLNELAHKKIGILNSNLSYISSYLNSINNISYTQYETFKELISALDSAEISYALIPLNEYLNEILLNNYYINYHFGDLKIYYTLQLLEKDNLSNIIKKYFNTWKETEYDSSYDESYLNLFINSLDIAKKDLDTLTNKVFTYGFIENSPYEVIMGGNYGGIISTYLKYFSDFSNVEFKFVKYKSINNLNYAISKKEVDLYYNTIESSNEYKEVPSLQNINYSIIAKTDNYLTINSIKTLSDQNIYILEGSPIASYLQAQNINIKTVKNYKELFKKAKKDNILIAIDNNVYNYYSKNQLKSYTIRYTETLSETYNFKTNANDTFYTIMSKYINTLDPGVITNIGLQNHAITVRNGSILMKIAMYILIIIALIATAGFVVYKYSRRITFAKKVRKDDKIRFIDQLTSLKNRNYLNENIDSWNKNAMYPQSCVVMDLNDIQEINDTLGYDQGDDQIKAAANILIKTQPDNSDIIRTDGNEFLIYLVGYQEKQVISYIRKLYKEIKNMPFDYGAVIGYSMIMDNLKSIEDAINEAVEDMRTKKEETNEE